MIAVFVRTGLTLLRFFTKLLGSPKHSSRATAGEVLLTGTFHSSNWIRAHIVPMRDSGKFERLTMVTTSDVVFPPGIEVVRPAAWMIGIFGATVARMITFVALACWRRPAWIGGFHLLFNGLLAIVLARLLRRQSLYFCVGGPAEFKDGGLLSENRLLGKLSEPDLQIEALLLSFVKMSNLCICMGSGAARFLTERLKIAVMVNPGGVDAETVELPKSYELIYLGRLAPIKNLPELIKAVALLNRERVTRLVIVGSGELEDTLRLEAKRLKVDDVVEFAGQQSNTGEWLARARIFVLPSISEGLSLSLMEALSSGLPAVVSDVGDLADLVVNGQNGYLLKRADAKQIADTINLCLDDENYNRLSANARRTAASVSSEAAAKRWRTFIDGSEGLCAASPVA